MGKYLVPVTDSTNRMKSSRSIVGYIPFLIALLTGIGFSQTDPSKLNDRNGEKLLLLPFQVHGLPPEDALLLGKRFADALKESHRFDIVLKDSLQGAEGSPDPRSLAQIGRTIGANKVVHISVVRREKLFVLQIRLVNVTDAALLYAERVDYAGEFSSLLAEVVPEQARKLSKAHLDAKAPWTKAAFLFGACLGAILWILWHFRRKETVSSKKTRGDIAPEKE